MRRTSLSGRTYIRSIIGDGEVDDKAIWMVGKGILQAAKVGMLIKTGSVRDLQQMARPKRFELLTPRFVVCAVPLKSLRFVTVRSDTIDGITSFAVLDDVPIPQDWASTST